MNHPFPNKLRNSSPIIILAMVLLFIAIISAQASMAKGDQVERRANVPYLGTDTDEVTSDGLLMLPVVINDTSTGNDGEFFLSPSGNDSHSGTTPGQAWATFEHAWPLLEPGDILTLMDGVYYQSIHPMHVGEIGNPVTVRAQNDGQAIIDGQGDRIPIHIENYRRSYLVIEGIVAQNSIDTVIGISGDHNVLRRVSAYNANTDENSHAIGIAGDYNLVEDCVASGTGRKMVFVFQGSHNTIRRCFADWREWDGRNWSSCWPWGEGLEFYGASNNILENSIAYGHVSRAGVSLLAQYPQKANNNKILGTMSVLAGMKEDGTPMVWGDTRPQPSEFPCVQNFDESPNLLSGFRMGGSGQIHNTLLQDIFAWGSARYGLTAVRSTNHADYNNNHVNRATIVNNGLNNIPRWGGVGAGASQSGLALINSIENSYIENIWMGDSTYVTQEGEGARLINRYVDGVLTDEALWPWPMEERIKAEMGYSVTCRMGTIINDAYAAGKAAEGIDMNSRDPNWASDPNNLVVQACDN
jgi:hypothetical protein